MAENSVGRKQGMKLAGLGIVVGIAAALGVARLLVDLLYGTKAIDPITFAGVVLGLGTVALAACYLAARRAVRVVPITALRRNSRWPRDFYFRRLAHYL